MKNERIPDHPAFLRLSGEERERLADAAELWEAPEGAFVHREGDPGEDMLLVLEGRLESEAGDGTLRRWFPGELWGASHPSRPEPSVPALVAAESSRWFRWKGSAFRSFLESNPRILKALSPLEDSEGRLVSGLPAVPGVGKGIRRRRFRPSLKQALPGLAAVVVVGALLSWAAVRIDGAPPQIPLAAPAVYAGWLLIFLLRRGLTEYSMDEDSVISRRFDWRGFAVVSRHVPMDGVQGVETARDGWARRLLGYGTVVVKTSAVEGVLMLVDVDAPEAIAEEIRASRRDSEVRNEARERMEMRRMLETGMAPGTAPERIRGAAVSPEEGSESSSGELRIRKSLVVLVGRLLLPLISAAAALLAAAFAGTRVEVDRRIVVVALLAILAWALYRFEDWRNDSFRVSGGYVVDLYRKPLGLKETRRQVDLASVQNIRTEQKGPASFLFRFGNVILVTTGGASDTVLAGVARPWRIQDLLFRRREEELRRREEAERTRAREDLARFSEALDQIRPPGTPRS